MFFKNALYDDNSEDYGLTKEDVIRNEMAFVLLFLYTGLHTSMLVVGIPLSNIQGLLRVFRSWKWNLVYSLWCGVGYCGNCVLRSGYELILDWLDYFMSI